MPRFKLPTPPWPAHYKMPVVVYVGESMRVFSPSSAIPWTPADRSAVPLAYCSTNCFHISHTLTHSHAERLTLRPPCGGISVSRISEDAKASWAVARLGCQGVLGVATVGWVSAVWPVCMSAVCRTRVLWSSQTTQDKHTHTLTQTVEGGDC